VNRNSEIVTAGPVSIETYVDGQGPDVIVLPSYGRDGGRDFDPFTTALADAGYHPETGCRCNEHHRLLTGNGRHSPTSTVLETGVMTITLITGANKGLGYETARRLIGLGHTVLAGARDPQRGAKAADELGATFISIDPTDDDSVRAAAARVREEHGRLDVLINNAGTAAPRVGAEDLTADAAMEGFAVNVFGPIRVTHAFLPLLRAAEHPRIVNVSSGAGSFHRILDPGTAENAVTLPVYPATKAALTMLTVQYARALPGILVNAADPGFTGTDFNNQRGTQTVTEGTDAIVRLATLPPGGPTGTFQDRHGTVPW
jgi:NAD(P)-dependent dehydrogenase (short-subunit alcohol dehydrogenase family)